MKDETSIFGAKPERLDRLVFEALQDSEAEESAPTASPGTVLECPGGQIGRYKLINILGEGGMGIVYLAQQHQPMKRQVAVKIIKPGMDSKRVITRFEAERQALALLDHPNIAHVFDAGMTEAGRPYFVMEHVKGLPITEHCDRHKLTIEERLRLFQQVCEAVQHAHQKGIIHRDIKPSNILVSTVDDKAIPKIIDFGVAKAIAAPLTERTLFTEDSQLLGTPEYMSPEQADMPIEDIDTRSDIYSLGVLLYVLLTGCLPFDSDTLREGGIENIRKTIRETDPKTPSTRLNKLGEEAKRVAENRRTEIRTLAKHLRRELEWIPLKAMRKERSERYRSASELADDIENYLTGAPLLAGPLSTTYRFKKFVRRNKALVSGILIVAVTLTVGFIVSTALYFRAERLRVEAQLIADFLENDVLGSANRARTRYVTSSYHLDAASERLDEGKFKNMPLIEARLYNKLGILYRMLGESRKAEERLKIAIEIYQQCRGGKHPDTLQATNDLGYVYEKQGRYHDMEHLFYMNLKIERQVSTVEQQVGTMNGLAAAYHYLGKYEDAESLFDKALDFVQRKLRDENFFILPYIKCNLARVYGSQGRYDEAEQLFCRTMEASGWNNESHGWYTTELASMYRDWGRYDKAEPLFDEALEALRQIMGDDNFFTVQCMYGLVKLYVDQDRYDEALSLFNEALPIARQRMRPDHPITLRLVNARAVLHTKQKEYDDAQSLFKEALEGRRSELGDDHPATMETKNDLAVLYKEQDDYDKAEPLLLKTLEGRRLKLGDTHPHTLESWNHLIDLYEAWGKLEKAEEWRAKLPQTEAVDE